MVKKSDQIQAQIEALKVELREARSREKEEHKKMTEEVEGALGRLLLSFYEDGWETVDIPCLLRELDGRQPLSFKTRPALDSKDARDQFIALLKARKTEHEKLVAVSE